MSSMIPAAGWVAVYEIDDSIVATPLVCWHEDQYSPAIKGMVVNEGEVVEASSLDGFKTYEYDLDSASIDYLAVKNGN